MKEKDIYTLMDYNIYCIRDIDDNVEILPCILVELRKRTIFDKDITTIECIVDIVGEGGTLTRYTVQPELLYPTLRDAEVGFSEYIDSKLSKINQIKNHIESYREMIK